MPADREPRDTAAQADRESRGQVAAPGDRELISSSSRGAVPPAHRGRELFEHGLPDHELPDRRLLERIWRIVSRWAVPVMMTGAYLLLAATSETDAFGKALMAGGLGLVLTLWLIFRALTESAALMRALSVGDVARLFALTGDLRHHRRPAARARFLVARAFAHHLRGEHAAALAALDEASPAPDLQPLAQTIRIGALLELGRAPSGLGITVSSPRAPALAWLAEGQLALYAGDLDTASQRFTQVMDDIRAGSATRAIAHIYAARIAARRGDAAAAAHHRTAAASLASPEARWLREGGSDASTRYP
jgi:hypothetical protein